MSLVLQAFHHVFYLLLDFLPAVGAAIAGNSDTRWISLLRLQRLHANENTECSTYARYVRLKLTTTALAMLPVVKGLNVLP